MGKLALYSAGTEDKPNGFDDFSEMIWKPSLPAYENGLKVVGTPIGTPEFIARYEKKVVEAEAQLLHSISKFDNLQSA